jgi:hypothetical protein
MVHAPLPTGLSACKLGVFNDHSFLGVLSSMLGWFRCPASLIAVLSKGPENVVPPALSRFSGNNTDGVTPIEILGKVRDFDWFVRSSAANVGIFVSLAESAPIEPLEMLDDFKD